MYIVDFLLYAFSVIGIGITVAVAYQRTWRFSISEISKNLQVDITPISGTKSATFMRELITCFYK